MKLKIRKKNNRQTLGQKLAVVALRCRRSLYLAGIGTANIYGDTTPCVPEKLVPFSPTRGARSFVETIIK